MSKDSQDPPESEVIYYESLVEQNQEVELTTQFMDNNNIVQINEEEVVLPTIDNNNVLQTSGDMERSFDSIHGEKEKYTKPAADLSDEEPFHGFESMSQEDQLESSSIQFKSLVQETNIELSSDNIVLSWTEDHQERDNPVHSSVNSPCKQATDQTYDISEDSDIDFDDEIEYTDARLKNKKRRYLKRMEEPINEGDAVDDAEVDALKEEFKTFLSTIKYGHDSGTISSTIGFLFTHPFAWVKFEEKEDPNFKVTRQLNFKSSDYLKINNPMRWFLSQAGDSLKENASRR